MSRRAGAALAAVPGALPALALLAAALAVLAPAPGAAAAVDELLAGLVLVTALDIDPARLAAVRRRWVMIAVLAVAPLLGLALFGWALSRLTHGPTRTGLIALGLSPTEVAAVGLIGVAGGSVEVALAVLTGSLLASALVAPVLLGLLVRTAHHIDELALLARFALVVIAPLAAGLLLRARHPRLGSGERGLTGVAGLLVTGLIYASLSGIHGGDLAAAVGYGAAFLAGSSLAALLAVAAGRRLPSALGLVICMRDFAVAAAFAQAAGGSAAARLAGIYGVLMLLGGAAVAGLLRR